MDTESSGSAESEDEVGSYHVTKPSEKWNWNFSDLINISHTAFSC